MVTAWHRLGERAARSPGTVAACLAGMIPPGQIAGRLAAALGCEPRAAGALAAARVPLAGERWRWASQAEAVLGIDPERAYALALVLVPGRPPLLRRCLDLALAWRWCPAAGAVIRCGATAHRLTVAEAEVIRGLAATGAGPLVPRR